MTFSNSSVQHWHCHTFSTLKSEKNYDFGTIVVKNGHSVSSRETSLFKALPYTQVALLCILLRRHTWPYQFEIHTEKHIHERNIFHFEGSKNSGFLKQI